MSKWKEIETYMDSKSINELKKIRKEDAPTNSNAAGGVDMNPTGMSLKKKRELDARTKECIYNTT